MYLFRNLFFLVAFTFLIFGCNPPDDMTVTPGVLDPKGSTGVEWGDCDGKCLYAPLSSFEGVREHQFVAGTPLPERVAGYTVDDGTVFSKTYVGKVPQPLTWADGSGAGINNIHVSDLEYGQANYEDPNFQLDRHYPDEHRGYGEDRVFLRWDYPTELYSSPGNGISAELHSQVMEYVRSMDLAPDTLEIVREDIFDNTRTIVYHHPDAVNPVLNPKLQPSCTTLCRHYADEAVAHGDIGYKPYSQYLLEPFASSGYVYKARVVRRKQVVFKEGWADQRDMISHDYNLVVRYQGIAIEVKAASAFKEIWVDAKYNGAPVSAEEWFDAWRRSQ